MWFFPFSFLSILACLVKPNYQSVVPRNVLITISLAIDDQLYATITSISRSSSSLFFDVVIKLGPNISTDAISRLSQYCSDNGVENHILSGSDCGIYDAMNKAISFARERYSGYCWFVNAGDFCDSGIQYFTDYLAENVIVHNTQPILLGGVNVFSKTNVFISSYQFRGFPNAWFKPPLHSSILFPSVLWHVFKFNETYAIAADVDYILKFSIRSEIIHTDATISSFYLGGVSSSRCDRCFLLLN